MYFLKFFLHVHLNCAPPNKPPNFSNPSFSNFFHALPSRYYLYPFRACKFVKPFLPPFDSLSTEHPTFSIDDSIHTVDPG